MNKYEERVKSLSGQMAKKRWPTSYFLFKLGGADDEEIARWHHLIDIMKGDAEDETKRTRNEVESIMRKAIPWKESAIINYLEDQGLIPPQTQTTCNGECNSGIPSHTCPYKADVNDDNTSCACCDKCTSACSDNR